ncbi:MAG: hypothetical protein ACFFCS_19690 [Candidatus Hodarchaeota archaeon]
MADEEFNEDEEYDVKKEKFPVKAFLKGILVIFIAIFAMYLMNYNWGNTIAIYGGITLICMASILMNYKPPKPKKVKQVYSIYKCNACNIKELHDFKDGDYVYKKLGPCWKCDGWMSISQIFAVEVKEKERKRISEPTRPSGPLENEM